MFSLVGIGRQHASSIRYDIFLSAISRTAYTIMHPMPVFGIEYKDRGEEVL